MERFLKSRYKIGEQIGEGPFNITYKGFVLGNDLPVVIKIYKRRVLNSPLIKQVKKKVKNFCTLAHPNIAKVYDGDYGWQGFYFVREYIEGKSLRELIKSGKGMEIDKVQDIGLSICEALRAAHESDIIHGALSSNNVFINKEGVVKVADFVIESSMRSATKESAEELLRSGGFLPPERVKGELLSKKGDIYNVGLLLYNMLTSRNPYNGTSEIDIALKLVREETSPPSKWNPNVPSYMDEIVLKAMDKDPLLRFDIGELYSSLKAKGIVGRKEEGEVPTLSFEASFEEAEKLQETEKEEKKKPFISIWFWVVFVILIFFSFSLFYFRYLLIWE